MLNIIDPKEHMTNQIDDQKKRKSDGSEMAPESFGLLTQSFESFESQNLESFDVTLN